MIEFLSGITLACFAAAGLFFLKFWRSSKDRFFLLFAAACWLIAIERIVLFIASDGGHGIRNAQTEAVSWVYLIRLAAFLIILFAIVEKNRKSTS